MERAKLIIVAILLAIVGAVIPILVVLYLSVERAIQTEQKHLSNITHEVVKRASHTASLAREALYELNKLHIQSVCAPDHLNAMRKITVDNPVVEEIGFFENGLLKCSIWGAANSPVSQYAPDLITARGFGASFNIKSMVRNNKLLIAFQYGNYYILVDPLRFLDILVDPSVQIALTTQKGVLIAERHRPDMKLVKQFSQDHQQVEDKIIAYTSSDEGFVATAIESREVLYNELRNELGLLLPLAIAISAFIIGLVIYFSQHRLSIAGELASAIKNKRLTLFYQPIVSLKTGQCVGAEALVRWFRPSGEQLSPDLFIPIAEKEGLITKITEQVIDLVIADLGKVLSVDRDLHISINLSAADIKKGQILKTLEAKLATTFILNSQIWLEITERAFVELNFAKEMIQNARSLGYVVAIDDFGTGYSSLSYLQNLELDVLKIDKSFIASIRTDSATSNVTPHIIDMAKALNLKILAEGIELVEQAEYLDLKEVEYGQGWLYSKALNVDDFIAFYKDKNKKI
ncbi:regulatory protein (EAL domain) [Legionella quinlivanii]|uniref:cyclic-guanylate-specific phosphodiesterase n=1 Tax=Legionella quinlivanii TaxID=45073 RepID=A0A0W0XKP3_9GAMM|nr:EAL domain-containing protein [Legionella quinlivanii]KTD45249.1 regulatory protein (EAL domain) [Legionella quinlivanii]SEG03880.1 sensor c-di-GMP phosphodiesterase, contains CSS-motif sensor and EAL domain [Legionella quinlivanii DSM 21216]STY11451.1 regulatory protein (EAL domain) [Legionella quinlivanii]